MELRPSNGYNVVFESAVDALIVGDAPALRALLRDHPELIRARSARPHHATLLHYVGTNGVEDERQKYPPNALEMLHILLAAGADINAEADLYGGGATTFGLAATSIHPAKAGIIIPLLETLLEAGASIEHPRAGGNGQLTINACLHNGRPEAADFLVRKGAQMDLEAAAGTGRLDVVKTYFKADGTMTPAATRTQMEYGFAWACEFGHTAVAAWLLDRGMDPEKNIGGLSGLHWAILGGHEDIIEWLLHQKIDLEKRNIYGGTALGAAFYASIHSDPVYRWPDDQVDYIRIIEMLLKAGAQIEPDTLKWLAFEKGLSPDMKVRMEEVLRRYGATS